MIHHPSSYQKEVSNLSTPENFQKYLLLDYSFLNDYQLIHSPINSEFQFLALIKSTQQLVKFVKKKFLSTSTHKGRSMYLRFQSMFSMFLKGLILADNMFILQEGQKNYFYYIIQPYLKINPYESIALPFMTLQNYLIQNKENIVGFQPRKELFIKCKNLFDSLTDHNQPYCGLNTRNIVIDDEGNMFLMPFSLQYNLLNKPYERSYYPIEALKLLKNQPQKQEVKHLVKWDIWSLGCISLQIFLYLTPFFLSTSAQRQINKIQNQKNFIFKDFNQQYLIRDQQTSSNNSNIELNSSLKQELERQAGEMQKIYNFFVNVFNFDQQKRCISFQMPQENNRPKHKKPTKRSIQAQAYAKQVLKDKIFFNSTQNSTAKQIKQLNPSIFCLNYKELNIFQTIQSHQVPNFLHKNQSFEIKFISLIVYRKNLATVQNLEEIEATIDFPNGQKFKFYLNMPKRNHNAKQFQIEINRKITFKSKTVQFVEALLDQDVLITLKMKNFPGKPKWVVFINLCALVIRDENGQRVWNKPIKGSYRSQKSNSTYFQLKIQAQVLNQIQQIKNKTQNNLRKQTINNQCNDVQESNSFAQSSVKNQTLSEECKQTSRFQMKNFNLHPDHKPITNKNQLQTNNQKQTQKKDYLNDDESERQTCISKEKGQNPLINGTQNKKNTKHINLSNKIKNLLNNLSALPTN